MNYEPMIVAGVTGAIVAFIRGGSLGRWFRGLYRKARQRRPNRRPEIREEFGSRPRDFLRGYTGIPD